MQGRTNAGVCRHAQRYSRLVHSVTRREGGPFELRLQIRFATAAIVANLSEGTDQSRGTPAFACAAALRAARECLCCAGLLRARGAMSAETYRRLSAGARRIAAEITTLKRTSRN